MASLTVGDTDVHCRTGTGREPAVVLVHSSGMSSRQFRRLSRELDERGQRWLAPDLMGYGDNPEWPVGTPFSLDADVGIVRAALCALDAPAVVFGHSYGGSLALRAAAAEPSRVAGVVVHDPVLWGVLRANDPVGAEQALLDIDRDGLFFDVERGGGEQWFRRFVDFWTGPGSFEGLGARQRAGFLARGGKTFLEVRALCEDITPPEAYRAIPCPIVVTTGRDSPAIERRTCEMLVRDLPNARLCEVPGGHMAPLTDPAGVHAELFKLL